MHHFLASSVKFVPILLRSRSASITCLLFGLSISASAAESTWKGSDGNWSDRSHWTTPPTAADTVRLSPQSPLTITLDTDTTLTGIIFDADAKASLSGSSTLNLAAGGTIAKLKAAKPSNDRIDVPLHLLGDAKFTNDGQWVRRANQLIIQKPLSGAGTLTITGKSDGAVSLFADNSQSFHGEIVLQTGVLLVGHDHALGDTAHGTRLMGGMLFLEGGINSPEPIVIQGKATWDSLGKSELSGPITFGPGASWSLDDDNGNGLILSGAIDGPDNATFAITTGNITLTGESPNTFKGTHRFSSNARDDRHNVIRLDKPAGITAITGPLELHKQATLIWGADHQIADTSAVLLAGGVLRPSGHAETLGTLTLAGDAQIDFTDGGELRFADSAQTQWKPDAQLLITHWNRQHLSVGGPSAGLTSTQVARIGFRDPADQPPGLYRAMMRNDGSIVPTDQPVTPVNTPFEISSHADAERARLYEVDGLAQLTGPKTALKPGMVISFFGDSITWLNGYVSRIDKAIQASPSTREMKIVLHNHGINGGGAMQILDGSPKDAYGTGHQAPFAQVIAADKADIAVLFIGINDVWWRKTKPDDFRNQLTQIASAAQTHGTRLVIATMAVQGERPDGTNPNDKKIEQYSQITRDVAKTANVPLVDLRKAYIAYEQNHNRELQLDGSLRSRESGLLTTDGVHPTPKGNELLANLIALGIQQAAGR